MHVSSTAINAVAITKHLTRSVNLVRSDSQCRDLGIRGKRKTPRVATGAGDGLQQAKNAVIACQRQGRPPITATPPRLPRLGKKSRRWDEESSSNSVFLSRSPSSETPVFCPVPPPFFCPVPPRAPPPQFLGIRGNKKKNGRFR